MTIPTNLKPDITGITLPQDKGNRTGEAEFLEAYANGPYGHLKEAKASDILVFTSVNNELNILLIQRGNHPYKGYWSFPGGFVDDNEDPTDAAVRELEEETTLKITRDDLTMVGVYDEDWRDPRIKNNVGYAHALYTKHLPAFEAADDAAHAELVPVAEILNGTIKLAFDHGKIILDALR